LWLSVKIKQSGKTGRLRVPVWIPTLARWNHFQCLCVIKENDMRLRYTPLSVAITLALSSAHSSVLAQTSPSQSAIDAGNGFDNFFFIFDKLKVYGG
jgi:hypothetical protein